MAYRIYQIFLTYLNNTPCKKLPLAKFSKKKKKIVLNPAERNLHA